VIDPLAGQRKAINVCDTCGRRLTGKRGELLSTDSRGNQTAWCVDHARDRPPWYGRAGWAWMREYDRLWAKAEEMELEELLRDGGRDLVFDHRPPLAECEVRKVGSMEVTVLWVRQPAPDRWTVRVARKVPEKVLMLRTGCLPFTSEKRGVIHAPTPKEVEQASVDSAYIGHADPLDAGQKPPGDVGRYRASVQAKVRFAEEQAEAHGDRIAAQQAKQLARRIHRLQLDAAKYGVDISPQLAGMLRQAEQAVGEARREAA